MRRRLIGPSCAAAVLSLATIAAAGQATPQAPASAPVQSGREEPGALGQPGQRAGKPGASTAGTRTDTTSQPGTELTGRSTAGQVTLTGCVERGDTSQFVLTAQRDDHTGLSGSATRSTSTTGTTSGSRAGTTSTGANGHDAVAYHLVGDKDLARYVGQRVQIVGTVQANAATPSAALRGDNRSSVADNRHDNGSAPGGGVTNSTASSSTPVDTTASASAPARDRDRDAATDRLERKPTSSAGHDTTTTAAAGATAESGQPNAVATTGTAPATMEGIIVSSVKSIGGSCR